MQQKTDPQRRESVFQFIKTVSQNTLEGVYADDRRIFYSNHMAKSPNRYRISSRLFAGTFGCFFGKTI